MEKEKLFSMNFILLIFGQASSLFGNYSLKLALSMYILELTGSAVTFAGLLAAATVPMILLSPFGGILADRINRKYIMVALDFLSGLVILGTTFFFSERNAIFCIGFLLVMLSVLGAFESPTVQAAIPQMQTGDNLLRANAVVNQIAAIASLVAPLLGSLLYKTLGLMPVLYLSMACFFLTAFLECFLHLSSIKYTKKGGILETVKSDFLESIRFVVKKQPQIMKLLLLAATVGFLAVGILTVGFPYIILTLLKLDAGFYGMAESFSGLAAILGSLGVGVFAAKLKNKHLYWILLFFGFCFLPIGIVFLYPSGQILQYIIFVVFVCIMQMLACIFSIFALSIIQKKTPIDILGKVMAYTATVSMCAQPFGQMLYGILFDSFSSVVWIIFFLTGILVLGITFLSQKVFYE